jgi:2-keto-3-deoxy-6-phosphogluconate aldolase
MTNEELIHRLCTGRVVPVVRMNSTAHARTLIGRLRKAVINLFEVTMPTPGAVELIGEPSYDARLLIGAATAPVPSASRVLAAM